MMMMMMMMSFVTAAELDLHWLWDNRCDDCHGHAGEFARQFLTEANGELLGRHHVQDLRRFMQNHYLNPDEVDAIYDMLLAQTRTPARFKTECSRCHESAAIFVRRSLQLKEGKLVSRQSGRNVRRFLENHQGLQAEDVEYFTRLLTRVAQEVHPQE